MEWGRTARGDRRHVLAEDVPGPRLYVGVALCGILLTNLLETDPGFWVICLNCETLLQAMESV